MLVHLACAVACVLGCRIHAVPAPDLVVVSVHASPLVSRVVVRRSTEQASQPLRRASPEGEFVGAVAVEPGTLALSIDAYDGRDRRIGAITASVTVTRGDPAQVLVAFGGESSRSGVGHPLIEALVAARSSVVAGTRLMLDARVDGEGDGDTTQAWSTTPVGCGTFESPRSASTSWTALAVGTCTITLTATRAGYVDQRSVVVAVRSRARSYRYPLQPSPDGRYLVDQRGVPFLIKGEAAWLAIVNLTEEEQERYLADREAKGFNLVEVMLLNADYTTAPNPAPPANRHGERPFRNAGDFATPDDAYFDRAVAFVDRAARHGIAVLLAPMYLGFDGGHEGWWGSLTGPANTRDVCHRYGRYVGGKFKDRKNVLWLAGGDYAPPPDSEGEARHWEMLNGIKDSGAAQLWTGHWNVRHLGGISADEARFAPAMDMNGVYQYVNPYQYALRARGATPPRPVFLLESAYEREHSNSKVQPFRKAWWWTMSSGGSGILWGNNFLWMCETARGTYAADYGTTADHTVSSWAAELESPGTYEALHLHAFFEALPWYRLVPSFPASGGFEIVTASRGSAASQITAAATAEGDVVVAYVPPTGTGPRPFGLDLSRLRGAARARWYDPSTGQYVLIATAVPPSQYVEFTTPGANGSGTNDWALVVDVPGS